VIGIDIVKISRIEKMINRFGNRAFRKIFDKDEISLIKHSQTAAGFFASKEAVSKALKTGIGKECGFFDIKIHKDKNGAPYFTLKKEIIKKYNIIETSLSITHEKEYAIAVAIIISSSKKSCKLFH